MKNLILRNLKQCSMLKHCPERSSSPETFPGSPFVTYDIIRWRTSLNTVHKGGIPRLGIVNHEACSPRDLIA
jgi:hypothetical protein